MALHTLSTTRDSELPSQSEQAAAPSQHWNEAALEMLNEYAVVLGVPLTCVEVATGKVRARTQPDEPFVLPKMVQEKLSESREPRIFDLNTGVAWFSLPLPRLEGIPVVAVGFMLQRPGVRPNDLIVAASQADWSQSQLDAWLEQLPVCTPRTLFRFLAAAVNLSVQQDQESALRKEVDDLATQLEYTYEEICLLHALTQNLQISRAPRELAELALQRLHCLIKAEAHAIWLDDPKGGAHFLVEGDIPFDELGMARFIARFEGHDWSRPLVKNRIKGTLLGADYPGLQNIIVVSIAEGMHRSGWLVCCNLSQGREFGTVEARLLSSIASILGTHGRNIDLYRQHDELLLSFVRSLVSSLDAKDAYTRGHSERVALIARRIGEQLRLPEEDLYDIYLAGLLHDIGKIGVDDSILRKPGQLTDEEFKQIQKHPIIGYNILAGIKNLQAVIPGVRHHHEAWSGKGYPDGLAGEQIPLMARILAVADSYDAMGSDRPYRNGMPIETLEGILQRGAGQQWDARVIEAYFAVRDDIKRICETYSPNNGNLLRVGGFDEQL